MAAAVSTPLSSSTTTTSMPPDQHHLSRNNNDRNHLLSSSRGVLIVGEVLADSTATVGDSSVDGIAVEDNLQVTESRPVDYPSAAAVAESVRRSDYYCISGPTDLSRTAGMSDVTHQVAEEQAEESGSSIHRCLQDTSSTSSQLRVSDTSTSYAGASYVKFGGYLDGQGIIHSHQADGEEEEKTEGHEEDVENTLSNLQEMASEQDSSDEQNVDIGVKEILEASQVFARSYPDRRFSSSLEKFYSSSKRHLYPSLDDVNVPKLESASEPSQQPATHSNRGNLQERIVPEPPATEDDDDDVKIGAASAVRDSPAYAYASAAYASTEDGSHTYAVASLGDLTTPAAEATVLETARNAEEDLLEKLAREDAELAAMKRAAYNGEVSGYETSVSSPSPHVSANYIPGERATVVEITEHYVHPSDISNDAVTAELIGEDFNNVSSASTAAADNISESPARAHAASTTEAVLAMDDSLVNSEATIIDQQTNWNSPYAEEAVVLHGDTSTPYMEQKPPATPTTNLDEWRDTQRVYFDATENSYEEVSTVAVAAYETQVEGRSREGNAANEPRVAFADEVGEVVGVSEEFHPLEVPDDEAEAELVGEDFNCAVALPQRSVNEAITSSSGDSMASSHELQAAMVVGYEGDEGMSPSPMVTARAYSYGSPRPERITPTTRAHSAPPSHRQDISEIEDIASTHRLTLEEDVAELEAVAEDDWMRTSSSLGETSGDSAIIVMKPPTEREVNAAVHVATLPASFPSASIDNATCCTVDNPPAHPPMQAAVRAASLNAYGSAPPQATFDETDCHAMAAMRQRESMGAASETSTITEPVDIPAPTSFHSSGGLNEGGTSGGGSVSSSTSNRGFQTKITTSITRGMEMLFGDAKPSTERSSFDNETAAQFVVPRTLLPWSVIHSEATDMWVATVNTNQKALESKNVIEASKSLRAFSVVTERQATCLAKAWSPPKMHPFSKHPACHICKAKFAVFRRACHCRNCGICVCTSCVVPWPSKMVPETYNIKKESFINICKACDWLCTSFRLALLEGDLDQTIALHSTGNVNLVTPFANVKGELFYPVHCAALGGNLAILKWLVDEHCCPIKSVRVSGRCRDSSNSFTEISTSKGRSLLGIALENRNVGIVRYLVVEKGIQLSGEKDINMDTLCRNLDLVLRLLPEEASRNTGNATAEGVHLAALAEESSLDELSNPDTGHDMRALNDNASDASLNDACIICFDATIDCVATPCGHQICCMKCSKNIERCPVCAVRCSFMRVFRP